MYFGASIKSARFGIMGIPNLCITGLFLRPLWQKGKRRSVHLVDFTDVVIS